MAYTPDPHIFRAQIESARAIAKPGQGVWAGVGAYRLTIGEVVKNIATARQIGASGVVLFSHESLDNTSMETLRRESFARPPLLAAVPAMFSRP
jgi:hypothetical protein